MPSLSAWRPPDRSPFPSVVAQVTDQLEQEATELSSLFLRYYALLRSATDAETRIVVTNLIHSLEARLAQLGVVPPQRPARTAPHGSVGRPVEG
jgi:hypothetical protein